VFSQYTASSSGFESVAPEVHQLKGAKVSVLNLFRLDGHVAVVTGGGKGIGRGIALALADAGADVAVAARSRSDVEAVAAEIRRRERRSAGYPVDVTAAGAQEQLAKFAFAEFGKLTIWVNNAGGLPDATPRYLIRTPEDRWDAQMNLNLKAVWTGAIAAAGQMKDGGAIINISSRTAFGGHKKNGPYAAAKAAVNSLTETLAIELAPNIRVNAVGPGPIRTQNFDESIKLDETGTEEFRRSLNLPLSRYGTPQDIGAAVVFLASPASSWITGQCLYVAGGM
jgi:7-alpha-hydroxysteroid dehydrogenase